MFRVLIAGILHNGIHQIGQIQILLVQLRLLVFQPGQGQGVLHQGAHQITLPSYPGQEMLGINPFLYATDGHINPGQGRSQLMGEIGDQPALGLDQIADSLSHPVKGLCQRGQLVVPVTQQCPGPGSQITLAELAGCQLQLANGIHQVPVDHQTQCQ